MRDIIESAENASKKLQRVKLIAAFITLCLTLTVTVLVSEDKQTLLDIKSKIGKVSSYNKTNCSETTEVYVSNILSVRTCKESNGRFLVLCDNDSQCMIMNKKQWDLLILKQFGIDDFFG